MEIISWKMRAYDFCSLIRSSRRRRSSHRERVGLLIRMKKWIKVIQSVFNGTIFICETNFFSHKEDDEKGMVKIFFGTPMFLSLLF